MENGVAGGAYTSPLSGGSRPPFAAQLSYTSEGSLNNMSLDGWSPSQFGTLSPGEGDPYGSLRPSFVIILLCFNFF